MTIALIAHDAKKELMIQFCIAYCGILSRHTLCATGTTGKQVAEATGLRIQRYLSGSQGGDQQIAARISCNEIDVLLFFRDPINRKASEPNEMNLLRLCRSQPTLQLRKRSSWRWSVAIWTGGKSAIRPFKHTAFLAAQGCRQVFVQLSPLFRKGKFFAVRSPECEEVFHTWQSKSHVPREQKM